MFENSQPAQEQSSHQDEPQPKTNEEQIHSVSPIIEFETDKFPGNDETSRNQVPILKPESDFDIQSDIFICESSKKSLRLKKLRRRDSAPTNSNSSTPEIPDRIGKEISQTQTANTVVGNDWPHANACIDHIGEVALPFPVRHYDLSLSQDSDAPLLDSIVSGKDISLGIVRPMVDLTNDDDDETNADGQISCKTRLTRSRSKPNQKRRMDYSTTSSTSIPIYLLDGDDFDSEINLDSKHTDKGPRQMIEHSTKAKTNTRSIVGGRKTSTTALARVGSKTPTNKSQSSDPPQLASQKRVIRRKVTKLPKVTVGNNRDDLHEGSDDNLLPASCSRAPIPLGTIQPSRPKDSPVRNYIPRQCYRNGGKDSKTRKELETFPYVDHDDEGRPGTQQDRETAQSANDYDDERDGDRDIGDDEAAFQFFTPINRLESGRVFAEQFEKRPRMGDPDSGNVHIVEQIMARAAKRAAERKDNPKAYYATKNKQSKKGTQYRFWRKKGAKRRSGPSKRKKAK